MLLQAQMKHVEDTIQACGLLSADENAFFSYLLILGGLIVELSKGGWVEASKGEIPIETT